MNPVYHGYLLQHYKKPLNNSSIEIYTFEKTAFNHLCGDQVLVRILLDNHQIRAISAQAKGCVISVATASIVSEYVKNRSCPDFKALNLTTVIDLIGIPLGPVRLKCALLSFDAIMQGLQSCCNQ